MQFSSVFHSKEKLNTLTVCEKKKTTLPHHTRDPSDVSDFTKLFHSHRRIHQADCCSIWLLNWHEPLNFTFSPLAWGRYDAWCLQIHPHGGFFIVDLFRTVWACGWFTCPSLNCLLFGTSNSAVRLKFAFHSLQRGAERETDLPLVWKWPAFDLWSSPVSGQFERGIDLSFSGYWSFRILVFFNFMAE